MKDSVFVQLKNLPSKTPKTRSLQMAYSSVITLIIIQKMSENRPRPVLRALGPGTVSCCLCRPSTRRLLCRLCHPGEEFGFRTSPPHRWPDFGLPTPRVQGQSFSLPDTAVQASLTSGQEGEPRADPTHLVLRVCLVWTPFRYSAGFGWTSVCVCSYAWSCWAHTRHKALRSTVIK